MKRFRVIPTLLLKDKGLIKTVKFKNPVYIGDPINTVRIFNEKEVDEIVILDIEASRKGSRPDIELLGEIAGESFMPLCYGGGIKDLKTIKEILRAGVEKVSLNSIALENPSFVREASENYGSSTIVVSIDVTKNIFGKYKVYNHLKAGSTKIDPVQHAVLMQEMGAGEIFLNVVSKDGTMSGYDLTIINQVANMVDIPLVASGGAGNLEDISKAVYIGGASAAAAGSMFVFHGKYRAVLVNYPSRDVLKSQVFSGIKPIL